MFYNGCKLGRSTSSTATVGPWLFHGQSHIIFIRDSRGIGWSPELSIFFFNILYTFSE